MGIMIIARWEHRLGDDCLPNAIDLCYQLLNGTYSPVIVPSPWGPGRPDQIMVLKGRNKLGYNPELIHELTK